LRFELGSSVIRSADDNFYPPTSTSYVRWKMRRALIFVIVLVACIVAVAGLLATAPAPGTVVSKPSAPRNLVAEAGDGQASLSWAAPLSSGGAPIEAYSVFRNDIVVAYPTTTTFVDTGLTNGQAYSYYVVAMNSAGSSPASNVVSGVVPHSPSPPPAASTEVDFIDVGQGDSILISTADSKHILIDAGPESADTTIISFLQGHSVTVVDALVITHPDADHIGGADEVLATFTVLSVYHPGFVKDTVAYNNFIAAANAEGCPIYTDAQVDPGDYLQLSSSVTFQVIAIDANAPDANSASIVIKMSYGTVDFLFEGDAPSAVEAQMMSNLALNLDVEILKVGHHGSSSSTSDAFLTATSPAVAVICVGAGNSYGHPTAQTLGRLSDHGTTVYRTDLDGAVVISTNGTTWSVS